MAYPTAADLQARLVTEAGLTVPVGFDYQSRIDAAIEWWEDETGYKPFLAEGTAVEYKFDPPGPTPPRNSVVCGGGKLLDLGGGFTEVSSVKIGVIPDDAGEALEENEDYWLLPDNASELSQPFNMIRFATPIFGARQSIRVTGKRGWAALLPKRVWLAILSYAAALSARTLREGFAGGLVEIKENDVTEKRDVALLKSLGDAWEAEAVATMRRYKRCDF